MTQTKEISVTFQEEKHLVLKSLLYINKLHNFGFSQ